MEYIKTVHTDIDHHALHSEIKEFLGTHGLWNHQQVSLTSISGDNDWECSVGKIHMLKYPERYYSTINKSIENTYIAELINRYPDYYRWRLLRIDARSCYSIHSDRNAGDKLNVRLHIPVNTNPDSFMCFYPEYPVPGKDMMVRYEHMPAGSTYKVNTTGLHTAINHGLEYRYHIVGVKYEDSNNWDD